MLPFERKEKIKEELQNGKIHLSEIAQLLGVSEITVRRDLKQLQKDGIIEVFHGGVARLVDTTRETSISKRVGIYSENKKKIGEYASRLIHDGDVIFIDSGTTTKYIIDGLSAKKNITLVTNGYLNIEESLNKKLSITVIGGDLKVETMAFVGPLTMKMIEMYHFDKCFLGANGIDSQFGLSNADPNESMIKEKAIEQSEEAYVVADQSKFDSCSVFKFSDIDKVKIITDQCPESYQSYENIISVDT